VQRGCIPHLRLGHRLVFFQVSKVLAALEKLRDQSRDQPPMSKSAHPQPYGLVKLYRSPETKELMSDPFAFVLLSQIAYRARWRVGPNRYGLRIGEALIGDVRSVGLTQQQYREAKKRLTRWDLQHSAQRTEEQSRASHLPSCLTSTCPLNNEQNNDLRNEPTTNQQRANND